MINFFIPLQMRGKIDNIKIFHQQSGCLAEDHSCSHQRAPLLWIDSISSSDNCKFPECSGLYEFETNRCHNNCYENFNFMCNQMGYFATKPDISRSYFGYTNNNSAPFCYIQLFNKLKNPSLRGLHARNLKLMKFLFILYVIIIQNLLIHCS